MARANDSGAAEEDKGLMSDPITRLNAALEGRYQIDREVGEGGMATVFLADDLRHERKVALKVLKPELAAVVGADRFLAEIKTTANLQHPHILPLFDSGETDSFLCYVMPYVEGETLRDRLDREHQLPVDDAVQIAKNVAEALDYAHSQGVIHRDIKPANILLQPGKPVVSDFGIALAVGAAGGGRLTETGLSLGTPHYMSPEQATGDQNVGPATDIYALACVLYEMLLGEPPYTGTNAQAVLAKILTDNPTMPVARRPAIPANVDAAIRKGLEKLPADRFTGASDFAKALADQGFRHGDLPSVPSAVSPGPWKRLWIATTGVGAALAVALGWTLLQPESRPVARFELMPGRGEALPPANVGVGYALSPEGQRVIYVAAALDGALQLWERRLDDVAPEPIPGTEDADNPVFSPDGQSVAFWTPEGVKTVSLLGGPAFTVVEALGGVRHLDWGADGFIYFTGESSTIDRVRATGGEPEPFASPRPEGSHSVRLPDVLPDGRGLLVTIRRDSPETSTIGVVGPDGGDVRELFAGVSARYAASGHIVYATVENTLMAAPFDLKRLDVTGPSFALLQGVAVRLPSHAAQFALSETGTLVYRTVGAGNSFQAVWVDRSGTVTEVDPDWTFGFNDNSSSLALSPDDNRLAVTLPDESGGSDIWIKQLDTGPLSLFTFQDGVNRRPSWSPDGRYLTFSSNASGRRAVLRARADGTGEVDTVLDVEAGIPEALYSPDGKWLIYRAGGLPAGEPDILALRVGVDSVGRELLAEDYTEWTPALSPDGRWLAYTSDETGRFEVYVRPFPEVDSGRQQVSAVGGWGPVWSHSGRELFYLSGQGDFDLIAVEVVDDPTFSAGRQDVLFSANDFTFPIRGYDVTVDDQRFVMLRAVPESAPKNDRFILVQNFFEELKRLAPN